MDELRTESTNTLDKREMLVRAAEREFLMHGYEGASLRQICSSAGVTTGALYFFFKNKEDLFKTVIWPVVGPMSSALAQTGKTSIIYALAHKGADEIPPESVTIATDFLELCYRQRSIVEIMVKNREVPVMEEVLSDLRCSFAETIRAHLAQDDQNSDAWDELVIRWLADIALDSVIEVLELDTELDAARRHMRTVFMFIRGGVCALRQAGSTLLADA